MIEPGAPAPDFTLPNQDGEDVSLAALLDRKLVLAFYPHDFSPVCTDQLSVYQEVLPRDRRAGGRGLVGISVDSTWSHKAFRSSSGSRSRCSRTFTPRARSRGPTAPTSPSAATRTDPWC